MPEYLQRVLQCQGKSWVTFKNLTTGFWQFFSHPCQVWLCGKNVTELMYELVAVPSLE